MSWQPADDPECPVPPGGVELVIVPRAHDLGGFEVRRALPARERQMVGSFIFFDQMGPGEFLAGTGLDLRPHPQIGRATVRICSMAHSCIGTAWAPSSRSFPATLTG